MPFQGKPTLREIHEYYSRKDVQNAILESAKNREVVAVFRNGRFGTRPNVLMYAQDIVQLVQTGALSIHGSVERWEQPMRLQPNMTNHKLDELRSGWDLLIDLDVKDFGHAKIAADVFIEALRKHGVKSISIKYTGGKSFHIGVPFESFPENIDYTPTKTQYPSASSAIISYLKNFVKDELEKEILKNEKSLEELATKTGKPLHEIVTSSGIDVYKIITEVGLFTSRHMFRLPYTLHENSMLASVPIKTSDIKNFKKSDAEIKNVKVKEKFLHSLEPNDASMLILEALDWYAARKKEEIERPAKKLTVTQPVPAEMFPPCVKKILGGVSDGRKRSLFILVNFLKSAGWQNDKIWEVIEEWNAKNEQPLSPTYVKTQLRWFDRQKKPILPPNCESKNYYKDMQVCIKDGNCTRLKNPLTYSLRKLKTHVAELKRQQMPKRKRRRKYDEYVDL